MSTLRRGRGRKTLAVTLVVLGAAGCATAGGLPPARTVVNSNGARINPTQERMLEVDQWFRAQVDNIVLDPSFLIDGMAADSMFYPWENLTLVGDTARIWYPQQFPDVIQPFQLYAHYHIMKELGRGGEWLPGGEALEGFDFERAALARVSDAWLYGRAVYAATAYPPLDELMFASDRGYLDPFLLTVRASEYPDERERWIEENPGRMEEFEAWYEQTFRGITGSR